MPKLFDPTEAPQASWLRGSVTFAALTTGAVAQHTVFTITGMVRYQFYAQCTASLTSSGAGTISYGHAGVVDALAAATTATTIDIGDGVTPDSTTLIEAAAFSAIAAEKSIVTIGTDITADILTATLTGGTMEYYLLWYPISVGATVTRGAELTAL